MPAPAGLDLSVMMSGRIASGKTSLAKRLSDRSGIRLVSFGSAVRGILPVSRDPTRSRLQDCGQRIMEAHGSKWLLRRALKLYGIPLGCGARVIFDGVRHVSMVAEIRRISRVSYVLFVDAGQDVRLARYRSRGRDGAEAFRKADGHAVEAELGRVRREADLVVENSGNDLGAACAMAEERLSMGGSMLSRGARRGGGAAHARRGASSAGSRGHALQEFLRHGGPEPTLRGPAAPEHPGRPGHVAAPRTARAPRKGA